MAAAAATRASTALPPRANILRPARDASGFAVATIPRRPRATGRKLNRVAYVSWGTEAAWGVVMT